MNQEEFYQKIPDWISHEKSRWNHITLMAYFCHKYEQKNKVRFRLVKWNADPGKGKESRDFAKLVKLFLPENFDDLSPNEKVESKVFVVQKIYNYINWMFDYKFRSGDKSVTGTNLFLMPSMINEFERMYSSFVQKNLKKDKMESFLDLLKVNYSQIFDSHQIEEIGDLKMLEKYILNYNLPASSIESIVVSKAKEMEVI